MNFNKAIGSFSVLLMLCPWVSFGLLDLDTQPWYIIACSLFIVSFNKKASQLILAAYLMPVITLLISISYFEIGFSTIRATASYFGLAVAIHSYYLFRKYYSSLVLPLLIKANIFWLIAGLIQEFTGKHSLDFLVVVRTTLDRGVTSLAPEPTFFAVFLIFLSWLIWIESNYQLNRLTQFLFLINLLSVVFLAKSPMGLLFVCYFIGCYSMIFVLRRKVIYRLILFIPAIGFFLALFLNQNPDTRLAKLIEVFSENPISLIKLDASVNSRVAHVILPLHGALSDGFIPHGFSAYQEHASSLITVYGDLFWFGYGGTKIMSFLSAAIYELGWFSLILFWLFFKFLWCSREPKMSIFNLIIFFSFLIAAIPVGFPLVGMILGAIYYRNRHHNHYHQLYANS